MAAFKEVQQRWDNFLGKIEQRFHEILSQTEAVLPDILELQDFDTTPFSVAWQGIESQIKDLLSKVDDTWENKVSPAFDEVKEERETAIEAAGGSLDKYYEQFYSAYYKELDKGHDLSRKLSRELIQYEVRIFSEAGRRLCNKAREILSKTFCCTQCQAPLAVRDNFFRSYYQACGYCQSINTFEPGTIARHVEHFALHPLANEKALEAYLVYMDIEENFRRQREDRPKSITADMVLDAQRKYAAKYLEARIGIIPDYEKDFEKDLQAKIEHVRRWVVDVHN